MPSHVSSVAAGLAAGAAALLLSACALLAPLPKPKGVAERLKAFPTRGLPLEGRATVRWSERQVPFIEAESDGDAAFALGLVHAHLRLGQMAMARMLARGRLSEMIGPMGVDIDRGLRALSYGRAAAEIERSMDDDALGSGSGASWTASTITRTARPNCRTISAFWASNQSPGPLPTSWPSGASGAPT